MNFLSFRFFCQRLTAIFVVFVVLPAAAWGGDWQELSSIKQAAQAFMRSNAEKSKLDMEFSIDALDSRLRLANCGKPLTVSARTRIRPGTLSLQVSCRGQRAWKIYLPVHVKIWRTVLAAAHPLPRGHSIVAGDIIKLREVQTNANQARYMQEQLPDLLGKILKRAQASGHPFDARYLSAPLWVRRGQTVTLLAETQSAQIRMKGNALADGVKGDLIKVRNLSSHRIVEGIVVKPGIISVRM